MNFESTSEPEEQNDPWRVTAEEALEDFAAKAAGYSRSQKWEQLCHIVKNIVLGLEQRSLDVVEAQENEMFLFGNQIDIVFYPGIGPCINEVIGLHDCDTYWTAEEQAGATSFDELKQKPEIAANILSCPHEMIEEALCMHAPVWQLIAYRLLCLGEEIESAQKRFGAGSVFGVGYADDGSVREPSIFEGLLTAVDPWDFSVSLSTNHGILPCSVKHLYPNYEHAEARLAEMLDAGALEASLDN